MSAIRPNKTKSVLVSLAALGILGSVLAPVFVQAIRPAHKPRLNLYVIGTATAIYQIDTDSGNSWASLNSAKVSDNARANVTAQEAKEIEVRNLGLSLPSNAVITGLSVLPEGYQVNPRYSVRVNDIRFRLVSGGAQLGSAAYQDSLFYGDLPPGDEVDNPQGSEVPLSHWGLTSVSPSTVNSASFGARLKLNYASDNSRLVYLDSLRVRVDYYLQGP